jgi:hypothetical protein
MRKLILLSAACIFLQYIYAQNATPSKRLTVFIDCSNTWCDMTFIRSEINLVDFLLDNQAADLHILITEQRNGSGGSQVQFIFFGQHNFKQLSDTIRFNIDPNATDFERRNDFIRYMKLGLAPYIVRTGAARDVVIEMKKANNSDDKKSNPSGQTKDPWNYWVFRIGGNGNISADKVYKSNRFSGNFSANRTTENLKVSFNGYASKNKSIYEFALDSVTTTKYVVNNDEMGFTHRLVKSITNHWSFGYEIGFSRSTFSNNKSRISPSMGIEYNIFPYKEVNNRYFTISYYMDMKRNEYFDTTLYDKTKETLWGQGAEINLTFNQKWGSTFLGISYHNYLHNWKYFNLGISGSLNVRITGGLSFNIYAFGGLTRDQLYLPKGGATEQEVLTRQRQIGSSYNYYTGFGLNYRFGSKLNNFVNPRFEGGNGGMVFF